MISKIKIRIESIIDDLDDAGLPVGESDKSVTEADGIYRYATDEARITYNEVLEGGESRCEIVFIGGGVTVRRRGAIESELYFKEGEVHHSIYSVPPYRFDAEVRTKRVRFELSPDGGRINLVYNMKIGGAEKSAVMKIWISRHSNQA